MRVQSKTLEVLAKYYYFCFSFCYRSKGDKGERGEDGEIGQIGFPGVRKDAFKYFSLYSFDLVFLQDVGPRGLPVS